MGSKKAGSKGNLSNRLRESGNVFLMLFGAIGMVGIVGASTMTVLKGPVRTMSQVTKRTIAENNMIAAGKLALIAAGQQSILNGDCDADNVVEPIPFNTSIPGTGGGTMPASIGVAKQDPWGMEYLYCAWDHGPILDHANCGGAGQNRLAGTTGSSVSEYVLAIVSAGSDGSFQTTCLDYVAPGTAILNKPTSSDDIVLGYTYAEAGAIAAGIWSEDGTTGAKIARNLSVEDSGGVETFGFDSNAGDLTIGNIGNIPNVNTDFISELTTNANITFLDPIVSAENITTTANISGADLAASGTSTLAIINASGAVDFDTTLNVDGDTDLSTVSTTGLAALNSATVATTLGVTGHTTLSTLGTSGLATLESLNVTNDTTLGNDAADTVAITGIATVGATLGVTGHTSLTTLGTSGLATLSSASVTTTLGVTGATTLSTLGTSGDVSIGGELDMGGDKIINLGTPTVNGDATTKLYVDTRVASGTGFSETDPQVDNLTANKWCVTNAGGTAIDCTANAPAAAGDDLGDHTATQAVDMATYKVTNMGNPTAAQDAATKAYVDASSSGKFVDGTDPNDAVYTTGNVGVGTTTPTEELDVVGDIKLSNSLMLGPIAGLAAPTYIAATDTLSGLSCSDGEVASWNNGGSVWECTAAGGGGGSAAGADRQVQFNDGGSAFGADTDFVYTSAGDLIVGSYQKDDTGAGTEDHRMFFDKVKGAFRAGRANNSQWDAANVGTTSIGIGNGAIAESTNSVAIGSFVTSDADDAMAIGYDTIVSGQYSMAIGAGNQAGGTNPTVSGDSSVGMFLGDNSNSVISGTRSLGIFLSQTSTTLAQDDTVSIMGANVGIGTVTPSQELEVNGDVLATSYLHSSDRRLKKEIKNIENPFDLLDAIHGKHYIWKKDDVAAYGVIAQDVETVMPEAVSTNPTTGMKAVEYDQLIAPLIDTVKILRDENKVLRQDVKELKRQMEMLENGQ